MVEVEVNVTHGVRKVKPTRRPHLMCRRRDGLHVVQLAGVIVHPTDHHGGQFVPGVLDGAKHILGAQEVLSIAWGEFNEVFVRVPAVQANLTAQRVPVAREGLRLAQQLSACALGLVKADEEQVQVDGEPIHGHDFVGLGAGQVTKAIHKPLVVADPRVLALEMAFDPPLRPIVEFDLQRGFGILGLKPEAVAREVHRVGAAVLRNVEARPKSAEGVRRIQFAGRLEGGKLSHAGLISH